MKIKRKRIFKSDICVDANGELYLHGVNFRGQNYRAYLYNSVFATQYMDCNFDSIDGNFDLYELCFASKTGTYLNKVKIPNTPIFK